MAGSSPASAERHSSSPWTTSDDNQLMQARQKGLNWQPIASKYFPTKTANACRKRHERLMEKRNSADTWDGGKIEQLAKAYTEVREEMWGLLAKRVDEKWQDVERKVRRRRKLLISPFIFCFPSLPRDHMTNPSSNQACSMLDARNSPSSNLNMHACIVVAQQNLFWR